MRVAEVLEFAQRNRLPPLQRKVLSYLEAHPEEVFGYRDEHLAEQVGAKPSGIGFSLWALQKAGLVERETVGGKVYFGSKEAVRKLRAGLGRPEEDPFERAYRNLLRIRERVGNLNNLETLDAVRAGE